MLAEDDPEDRFLIQRALQQARPGLQTLALRDGIELIEFLRGCPFEQLPRLVFIDLNMPRMDGRELLRVLRAEEGLRHLPVVVLTTSVEPQDRQQALALDAAAFISKPEAFRAMVAALRAVLDDKLGPPPPEAA